MQGLQRLVTTLTSFERRYAAYECMLFLAASEWSARNASAVITHMKSAVAILRTMGGFKVLPDPKKESSIWMFVNVCFYFDIRPLIRPQEFDPGPLSSHSALKTIHEAVQGDRPVVFRRITGTATSTLAGGTLVSLWEAMSEAQRAVDFIRSGRPLPSHQSAALHRWLFLRKLATRVRLEHLWHDLKLLIDDSAAQQKVVSSDAPTSPRHLLLLWQICLCMASRIFDELVFDRLHPADDSTGHWAFYFGRYLSFLRLLEQEVGAEPGQSEPTSDTNVQHEHHTVLLWLYLIGATVERLMFHQSDDQPPPAPPGGGRERSCAERFKKLVVETDHGPDDSIARTFEEDLIFSRRHSMQGVLDELLQNT